MKRSRLGLSSVSLAVGLAAVFAWFAAAASPVAAQQPPTPVAERLAHELEQIARPLLQQAEEEQEALAQTAAGDLLDRAIDLDPSNVERLRLRMELAEMAGDRQVLMEVLRKYIAQRGEDDAAQLRLVDLLADRQQTADGRLTFYRRIVDGPQSEQFSRPLRSRVAHRAASLAFEKGDDPAYRQHLRRAIELDQTNSSAAVDIYRYVMEREGATAADRAAALFTLLVADPTDAETHAAVGDQLLTHGAYEPALRWYEQAASLAGASGRPVSPVLTQKAMVALWGQGKTDEALAVLTPILGPLPVEGEQAAVAAGTAAAGGGEVDGDGDGGEAEATATPFPAPDPEGLEDAAEAGGSPPGEERAGTVDGEGEQQGGDGISPMLADMIWLDLMIRAGEDEALEPAVARMKRVLGDQWSPGWQADQAWAYLLAGRPVSEVAGLIEEVDAEAVPLAAVVRAAVQALGTETQAGLETLSELAAEQPEAILAEGVVHHRLENQKQAVAALGEVATEHASAVTGLLARSLLRRMEQAPPRIESAAAVTPVFADAPADLSALAGQPAQFVQLRIEPGKLTHEWPEGIHFDLVLRNVSPMPLSLGPNGSLNAQIALLIEPRINNRRGPRLSPVIVDLNRRLRLAAGESLRVGVRLDTHQAADLLKHRPGATVEFDLSAVLNPRMDQRGRLQPGLLGVTAYQRNFTYRPAGIDGENLDDWLARLKDRQDAEAVAAALLTLPPYAVAVRESASDVSDRIVSALSEQIAGLSTAERALVIAMLPPTAAARTVMHDVLDRIMGADATLPRLFYIARLAETTDDPILQAALESEDETLRAVATLIEQVITRIEAERAAREESSEGGGAGQSR